VIKAQEIELQFSQELEEMEEEEEKGSSIVLEVEVVVEGPLMAAPRGIK